MQRQVGNLPDLRLDLGKVLGDRFVAARQPVGQVGEGFAGEWHTHGHDDAAGGMLFGHAAEKDAPLRAGKKARFHRVFLSELLHIR